MGWSRTLPVATLAEGRPTLAEAGDEPVLLLLREGRVHALAALCPHKFTSLADGTLEGGRLRCPLHAASFDLATGEPGPGEGWAGLLPVYPSRVVDGVVEVDLTRRAGEPGGR